MRSLLKKAINMGIRVKPNRKPLSKNPDSDPTQPRTTGNYIQLHKFILIYIYIYIHSPYTVTVLPFQKQECRTDDNNVKTCMLNDILLGIVGYNNMILQVSQEISIPFRFNFTLRLTGRGEDKTRTREIVRVVNFEQKKRQGLKEL